MVDLRLGAMRSLSERERERKGEREKTHHQQNKKERKERIFMHEICTNM